MVIKELSGHTSPETAYVVESYPYSFKLRCKIRFWIESHPKHGQRVVSQTTNPKKPGVVWNKPKASTYSTLKALFLDEQGHVQNEALNPYSGEEGIDAFVARFPLTCATEVAQKALPVLRAHARACKRVIWTVRSDDGQPRQTAQEQVTLIAKLTVDELRKEQS